MNYRNALERCEWWMGWLHVLSSVVLIVAAVALVLGPTSRTTTWNLAFVAHFLVTTSYHHAKARTERRFQLARRHEGIAAALTRVLRRIQPDKAQVAWITTLIEKELATARRMFPRSKEDEVGR